MIKFFIVFFVLFILAYIIFPQPDYDGLDNRDQYP